MMKRFGPEGRRGQASSRQRGWEVLEALGADPRAEQFISGNLEAFLRLQRDTYHIFFSGGGAGEFRMIDEGVEATLRQGTACEIVVFDNRQNRVTAQNWRWELHALDVADFERHGHVTLPHCELHIPEDTGFRYHFMLQPQRTLKELLSQRRAGK